jgi:hypothetical protein
MAIVLVGIDLAKNVFAIDAVDEHVASGRIRAQPQLRANPRGTAGNRCRDDANKSGAAALIEAAGIGIRARTQ